MHLHIFPAARDDTLNQSRRLNPQKIRMWDNKDLQIEVRIIEERK